MTKKLEQIREKELYRECQFTATRSSGAGGQNVNKVNSRVSLRFDIKNSDLLDEEEKGIILRKISSKISGDGILIISSQLHRSQHQNKENAIIKFNQLIEKAFAPRKIRKASKPTKTSIQKRIKEKKMQSEKKKWRQKN